MKVKINENQLRQIVSETISNMLGEAAYDKNGNYDPQGHLVDIKRNLVATTDKMLELVNRVVMSYDKIAKEAESADKELSQKLNDIVSKLYVCGNDYIALNLIKAIELMNKKVPVDVEVIGFDNSIESKASKTQISTFDVNTEELGRITLYSIIHRIKDPKKLVTKITTKETSGRSSPSLSRLIPTRTSNSPSRSCLRSSTLSIVLIS